MEAKSWAAAVGIDVIRQAVGVLADVNTSDGAGNSKTNGLRFDYKYAVASTSGFSRQARSYADAHHVFLIDLSGPSYGPLRDSVARLAGALARATLGADRGATTEMRLILRAALGTESPSPGDPLTRAASGGRLSEEVLSLVGSLIYDLESAERAGDADQSTRLESVLIELHSLVEVLDAEPGLVLAFADSPSPVVLRPENIGAFETFLMSLDALGEPDPLRLIGAELVSTADFVWTLATDRGGPTLRLVVQGDLDGRGRIDQAGTNPPAGIGERRRPSVIALVLPLGGQPRPFWVEARR